MAEKKTLAERLADARARARKQAHQNAAADRRHVRETNRRIRKGK